ncbi:MAG: hypothetical protein APF80_11665 [Alphaproteobacteria bacterium BRH_c36]|nr:MAG: hypothetical protein APF80_11665 [Alphaproteobacteria bacterium BRH_c36]
MDRAIWAIFYDLGAADRDVYLRWFHDVHIPEKLARPGYVSAGHYAIVGADGRPGSTTGSQAAGAAGYVALFGGEDTSVFLNPSPAQIKPRQTEETRSMMGRRIGSRSFIAAQEWLAATTAARVERADGAIVLSCCDTPGQDEDFGAWCVQDLRPALQEHPGFRFVGKLLTTTGPMKHATFAGFESIDDALGFAANPPKTEWAERIAKSQAPIPGSPLVARRIWPA